MRESFTEAVEIAESAFAEELLSLELNPPVNSHRFDTPELRCLLGSLPNIHPQAARWPIQPAR